SAASDGFRELSGSVFNDSAVICSFCRTPQNLIFDFAKAVTGYPITIEGWRRVTGPRIVTIQRGLLLMGGPDVTWEPVEDDENPPRFYEPLPSGPYKGRTTDRGLVERKRAVYFETLGWDGRGIPRTETLERLGLEDLEPSMKRLRE
ncbi:MAG: aldehyde ferredoxin oxidoreductase C-terminal domain-containing protein, partial [Candidatus Bathyarchaeota archaeon]|nr:aldehyde ferredoxin oxidoreductase C-terminal domain-containing protein [Candidatus Bathyarchaeota archaeon]